MLVELPARELAVYQGILDRKSAKQMASEMGISATRVFAVRQKLVQLGVIRRCGALPPGITETRAYAWEPVPDVQVAPLVPDAATVHLQYPVVTERDERVPPITLIRWGSWSVQGIPMVDQAGRRPKDAMPTHKVVVVTDLRRGTWRVFLAPARERWTESETAFHLQRLGVTGEARQAITMMIASAIGVDAVFDLSRKGSQTP